MTRATAPALYLAGLVLLAALIGNPGLMEPLLAPLTANGAPAIYDRASLVTLTWAHLRLVALAVAASTLLAVTLGILVTRRSGAAFMPLSRSVVAIGQTLPPVAVLALAVPALGFGQAPTLLALFLYGLLPIFESTVAGLQGVPPAVGEAARGMGMGPGRRLLEVELPLAAPVILSGIRVSTMISLGTATIGSTVAAKGLGEVIIAGLLTANTAFVLQGGLIVALLAILLDRALAALERIVRRRTGAA